MTTRLTAAASTHPIPPVRIDSKETAMTDPTNPEANDDSTSTMSDDHDINLIDSIPIEHDSPMLDAWRRSPLLDETK